MQTIQFPIPKDRILMFTNKVTVDTVQKLSKEIIDIQLNDEYLTKIYHIHDINYQPKPIKIYIDNYGGYVYQCLGLLNIIKKCSTPIHTIVTGCAMSCGFLVSISGHKRFGYEYSTYMYHQLSALEYGKLKEIEENLVEAKRLQDIIEQHTIANTNISKKKLKDVFENKKDWFMNSKQALKNGVIDEIL